MHKCCQSLNIALLASLTGILEVWKQLYLLMLYIFIPLKHTQTSVFLQEFRGKKIVPFLLLFWFFCFPIGASPCFGIYCEQIWEFNSQQWEIISETMFWEQTAFEWLNKYFFHNHSILIYDLQRFGREKWIFKVHVCQCIRPLCLYVTSGFIVKNRKIEFQPFILIALSCLSVLPVASLVTLVCKIDSERND